MSKRISFRLSDKQYKSLSLFENKSKAIRSFIISGLLNSKIPSDEELNSLKEIYKELHTIGININQIATKLNTVGLLDKSSLENNIDKFLKLKKRLDQILDLYINV
ncbi:MAG: plasmid mobilization relaxosome protein MobC [Alphaproteobacteria bacterium]|nr:plasmid mobilization relaxosome protein MobC [Alphaproteobacteria bacterium]